MRLLYDQMLAELRCRRRTAGYDTIIITESIPDRAILERSLREKKFSSL